MSNPMKVNSKRSGYKAVYLALFLCVCVTELCAQSTGSSLSNKAIDGGIGLGSIIAVVASWSRNQSISYAILHGFLGWAYVIYFAFTREE
jgi:hypothetical protein